MKRWDENQKYKVLFMSVLGLMELNNSKKNRKNTEQILRWNKSQSYAQRK